MSKVKNALRRNLVNIPGCRTNRKIVAIESDDWGAIRLPSAAILKEIKKAGIDVSNDHYIQNDSLASEKDLTELFVLLKTIKNRAGESPKITANSIMANPDFIKIRESNYREYHNEPFTKTLKRYPEHGRSFDLWKEGMEAGLFRPQFHGREHLHVNRWMKGLSDKKSETFKTFQFSLYGISTISTNENRKSYMAAWEWDDEKDKEFSLKSIKEGLQLFEDTFGYRSLTTIAPNYTWNREIEEVLHENGVRLLQGGPVQRSPDVNRDGNKIIRHYTGQKNDLGLTYLVRNCRFEPSADPNKDWVASCLKEINTAFRWRKPAIIETHRVNFIGYIDPINRDRNLKLFKELLENIVKTWPDVEFLTSDELSHVIN